VNLSNQIKVLDKPRIVRVGDESGEVAAEVLLAEGDDRVVEGASSIPSGSGPS